MKEIKARDLRIGNLVNYKYYNPDPKGPDWAYEAVEIVEIKQSHLVFKHLNKKAKFKIAVLYAIPLTEEWIDKLSDEEYAFEGFGSRIIYKCIKFPAIKYDFSGECVLVYFQGKIINRVDYVHEWQNIHHALTREELTINN